MRVIYRFLVLALFVTSPSWAAPAQLPAVFIGPSMYCELAALSSEEVLNRLAVSYRGLLEYAGDEFTRERLEDLMNENTSLEKFFTPVRGAEQKSVALNEALTRLGDWVLLDSGDHGLTQSQIKTRLREVVREYLDQTKQEQEILIETRARKGDVGVQTTTGFEFIRDTSHAKLGESWRDESGMIWGDSVRGDYGGPSIMSHAQAVDYCRNRGAELPSVEDFIRLRKYMGAAHGFIKGEFPVGYKTQILPGLMNCTFWSSSLNPDNAEKALVFSGGRGEIFAHQLNSTSVCVRCVVRGGEVP